jgi:hypothetical protein
MSDLKLFRIELGVAAELQGAALTLEKPLCLEYIVVHEMTHRLERNHGERFTKLMDKFLPDWRSRRDKLNGASLAHEVWGTAQL